MAKNYNMTEVFKVVSEGTDFEAISDIARRMPLTFATVTAIVNGNKESISKFFGILPDYVTAGKIEKAIKAAVEGANDSEDVEDDASTDTEEIEKPKKEKPVKAKKEPEPVDDEEEETDEESYEGKTPQQLFKICKEKGIRVISKKSSEYYVRKLKEFEAANAKVEEPAEEEDDWGDEIEEKPVKSKKEKPVKKPKSESKPDDEEEEEEDWDI
jgi:hypothetical protein